MANLSFKRLPGEVPTLFPQDIFKKIPENHPVRIVDKVVDSLDVSFILKTYKGGGNSAYHPKVMIKILFYAYLNNIYSSRKIEKALHENIYFMWLAKHATPNFRTINEFRGKRLKENIDKLFTQIVMMLVELGFVSLKKQYIDGTIIESTSNRYTFVWRKSVEKNKGKLQEKIHNILEVIHRQIKLDSQENAYELPEEIDTELLQKKVEEINTALNREDISEKQKKVVKKELQKIEKNYLPRLSKYEEHRKILGGRNSYSKTDTDATFMRTKDDHLRNGQLKPSYNIQVSSEAQFITHFGIHQTSTDITCLKPHLESFKKNYGRVSEEVIADAGYGSEENYAYLEEEGIEAYVKYSSFDLEQTRKYRLNPSKVFNLYYNEKEDYYVCAMGQKLRKVGEGKRKTENGYVADISYYEAENCVGCPIRGVCYKNKSPKRRLEISRRLESFREQARRRLRSDLGVYHRKRRMVEVESVFGQIKHNNLFRRFSLRGLSKVFIEFGLIAIAHNLRKLARQLKGKLPEKFLLKGLLYIFFLFRAFYQKKQEKSGYLPQYLKHYILIKMINCFWRGELMDSPTMFRKPAALADAIEMHPAPRL